MVRQLFCSDIYVKVFLDKFEILNVNSGKRAVVEPDEPFTTTRLLIGQFLIAEECLKKGIKQVANNAFVSKSSRVIIQPKEMIEGGLSQVEERVLLELSAGAGAFKVKVHIGHEPAITELKKMISKL